jgi:hypothetical protein
LHDFSEVKDTSIRHSSCQEPSDQLGKRWQKKKASAKKTKRKKGGGKEEEKGKENETENPFFLIKKLKN